MVNNHEEGGDMENLTKKLEGELFLDLEDEESSEREEDGHLNLLGKLISDSQLTLWLLRVPSRECGIQQKV